MVVYLHSQSDDFRITSLNGERYQYVNNESVTEWTWRVQALKIGESRLWVSAAAIETTSEGLVEHVFAPIFRTVKIKGSLLYSSKDLFSFTFLAIIALFVLVYGAKTFLALFPKAASVPGRNAFRQVLNRFTNLIAENIANLSPQSRPSKEEKQ